MLASECHIHLKTHSVHVNVNEDNIRCFKYSQTHCEWEKFEDLDTATDWIFKPFDQYYYRVVLGSETDPE
jgi:hypothetical protein